MKAVTLVLTAMAGFVAGAIFCATGLYVLNIYYQRNFAPKISASGVLLYERNPDASASVLPPKGYYIQSSGVGRIYLQGNSISQYVGQNISVVGRMDTICGPDGIPCYPELLLASIQRAR